MIPVEKILLSGMHTFYPYKDREHGGICFDHSTEEELLVGVGCSFDDTAI